MFTSLSQAFDPYFRIMNDEELQHRNTQQINGRSAQLNGHEYATMLDEWLAIREERDFLRQRVAELERLLLDEVFLSGRFLSQSAEQPKPVPDRVH